jgi:hypothetical protein
LTSSTVTTKPIVEPTAGAASSGERPLGMVDAKDDASELGEKPDWRTGAGFDVIVTVMRQLPMASLHVTRDGVYQRKERLTVCQGTYAVKGEKIGLVAAKETCR